MRLQSLRSKLLVVVSLLVVGSGFLISLLVMNRYSDSLFETAMAHAENLAHALTLEATDKILINDLVALQKMLDYQMNSNPSVTYFFIVRDGQILAHSFNEGVPLELIDANDAIKENKGHFKKIVSKKGDRYIDIAWPIFSGKAGVLRLGLSEKPFRQQVTKLWLQMSILTLGILLIALTVSLLFIKKITGPVAILAKAAEKIDEGHLDVKVSLKGRDEVGKLTSSFNHMVARIKEYTQRLEKKTTELDRAHRQTRSSFAIIQDIGAQLNLKDVCSYLIRKFHGIVSCKQMVFLIFSADENILFTLSENEMKSLRAKSFETSIEYLKGLKGLTFTNKNNFNFALEHYSFQSAKRLTIFPISKENQLLGALFVVCHGQCRCDKKELKVIELILNQTSGAIKRAVLQEEEIRDLQNRIQKGAKYGGIVGKDPKMQVIYKLIEDVAPTDATVLIQGESGTGKELVAHTINSKSPRKDKPFVVINCSAYPATLLESEIFGHEKGAFTGAIRQKAGRFEQAHEGTVFLDEIGEISPAIGDLLSSAKSDSHGTILESEVRLLKDTLVECNWNKKKAALRLGISRSTLYEKLKKYQINQPTIH